MSENELDSLMRQADMSRKEEKESRHMKQTTLRAVHSQARCLQGVDWDNWQATIGALERFCELVLSLHDPDKAAKEEACVICSEHEVEEEIGRPLEEDLPCCREKEVAVTNYPVYMHKAGLVPEEPTAESSEESSWWCINDHTGCLWNDGHNICSHDGDSPSPLEGEPWCPGDKLGGVCPGIESGVDSDCPRWKEEA